MKTDTSRRTFLAAGLALPAAGLATTTASPAGPAPAPPQAAPSSGKITYRVLGKTGMRASSVGYGCMITSDPTVITRAVDMGINYFDTSRNYQGGQNERMVGAALGAKRKNIFLASKCDTRDRGRHPGGARYQPQGTRHRPPGRLASARQEQPGADLRRTGGRAAEGQAAGQGPVHRREHATELPAIVDRVIEAKIDVVQAQYSFASARELGPGHREAAPGRRRRDRHEGDGAGARGRGAARQRRAAAARQFRSGGAQVGHQESHRSPPPSPA